MKRLQIILTVILVCQVALAAFVLWPRPAAGGGTAGTLWGKLSASDIVAVTLYDKPDTSIKLQKAGDKWVLPASDDYPADGTRVSDLLTKVVEIKTNRLVSQDANNQVRLKVSPNDYLHRIDIQTADGTNRTLYVGSSAGARATHVRSGDRNLVYLAENINASDASAQPGTWIDPLYLNIAAADVTGLTLKNANGTYTFAKDGGGNWTMTGLAAGETFNKDSVTNMLSQVAPLRMARPLGKSDKQEYGVAQPAAVLTLQTKKDNQEKSYTLQVGSSKDATDNTYVVKSSESPYYVRVAEAGVRDLIDKKRDGFLHLPPTPAAAGTAPADLFPLGTPAPNQ